MELQNKVKDIINNIEEIIVGKRETIELVVVTLLAGGHLLLEDVPGVEKLLWQKLLPRRFTVDLHEYSLHRYPTQ